MVDEIHAANYSAGWAAWFDFHTSGTQEFD